MLRVLMAALFLVASTAAEAQPTRVTEVDLDKPGALEALEREKPYHHKKVMEEISKAQAIQVEPKPSVQKADAGPKDPRQKDATIVLPSDPAKKRLTVFVDNVLYRVTAHMTKHPGKVEKAR